MQYGDTIGGGGDPFARFGRRRNVPMPSLAAALAGGGGSLGGGGGGSLGGIPPGHMPPGGVPQPVAHLPQIGAMPPAHMPPGGPAPMPFAGHATTPPFPGPMPLSRGLRRFPSLRRHAPRPLSPPPIF